MGRRCYVEDPVQCQASVNTAKLGEELKLYNTSIVGPNGQVLNSAICNELSSFTGCSCPWVVFTFVIAPVLIFVLVLVLVFALVLVLVLVLVVV